MVWECYASLTLLDSMNLNETFDVTRTTTLMRCVGDTHCIKRPDCFSLSGAWNASDSPLCERHAHVAHSQLTVQVPDTKMLYTQDGDWNPEQLFQKRQPELRE